MTPERPPRRRDPQGAEPQPSSAQGHRFGPDLQCRDCGIRYRDHQRSPKPCKAARHRAPCEPDTEGGDVEPPTSPARRATRDRLPAPS
ncbi:MAG: hypothetical protein H6Q91_1402 [Deltaproteobacteria bacterium]|nr:hypothetical protein [Deltaproteobacteria bacterium]